MWARGFFRMPRETESPVEFVQNRLAKPPTAQRLLHRHITHLADAGFDGMQAAHANQPLGLVVSSDVRRGGVEFVAFTAGGLPPRLAQHAPAQLVVRHKLQLRLRGTNLHARMVAWASAWAKSIFDAQSEDKSCCES